MVRKKTKKERENQESPFLEKPTYTNFHPLAVLWKHLPTDERPKCYYNKQGWLVVQLFTKADEDD